LAALLVFFKWGWKISRITCVMKSTFRDRSGHFPQGGWTVSDDDRKANDEADEEVRAHVKEHGAMDDGAEDEVRAHVKQHGATDEGDDSGDSDDVEAHVKQH
jgi:hypothetical protein